MPDKPLKCYAIWVRGWEPHFEYPYWGEDAGKTKYKTYLRIREVWPDLRITDMAARAYPKPEEAGS